MTASPYVFFLHGHHTDPGRKGSEQGRTGWAKGKGSTCVRAVDNRMPYV